ncbi:MAG: FlgD immunoglobulin-like domain containing protein [bacterium]|nr:FlgD immunoglobulin-like domain containing protein [bacterium]
MKLKTKIFLINNLTLMSLLFIVLPTLANNPPNKPSNPFPANGATNQTVGSITLSWVGGDPDATDTVTYDIYFGTSTPPPNIYSGQGTTTYGVSQLVAGTWYYWQIVAKDNQGSSTNGSIWRFKTISNQSPGTPTNLSATAVAWDKINLLWKDNSDDETEFRIERKTGINGNYGTITTVGTNTTSYQDKGLNQTTTYSYRVRVYNSYNGKVSSYSNEASATTPLKPFFELYDNLFNPRKGEEVIIKYTLSRDTFVTIKIYTLYGEFINTLLSKGQSAGHHQITWSGKDENGNVVASGIYLVYFNAGDFEEIKKTAVIK